MELPGLLEHSSTLALSPSPKATEANLRRETRYGEMAFVEAEAEAAASPRLLAGVAVPTTVEST